MVKKEEAENLIMESSSGIKTQKNVNFARESSQSLDLDE
jgi:hypothetical protein